MYAPGVSLRPYVVATAPLQERIEAKDLHHRYDPTHVASAPFLDRLELLDAEAYGPEMMIPRWAFYDCAQLPGAVVGLAEDGKEPVTMYLATPMIEPGNWLGYSVAASSSVEDPHAAMVETIDLALRYLDVQRVTSLTQWDSPKLAVHAEFRPLELRSAWTPAHSDPATCVLRYTAGADEAPDAERYVDTKDSAVLRALQAEIEEGAAWLVVGPPEDGAVPLARAAS